MASTLSTFDFATHIRYTPRKIEDLTLSNRPSLGKIQKREDFVGESEVIPLIHVNPQGVAGSNRSTAQTNQTNVKGKKFTVVVGEYHGSVDIGDKVIKASRKNPGAFLQNMTAEMDGLYEQMADSLCVYMWGNGGGAIGQRASISTNTVTLVDPSDVMFFEEGMTVVASANDGSDSSHALRSGSTTVASIDRAGGTVTLTDASLIISFANNDFLFRSGDFFGNTGVVVLQGIQKQIPGTSTPAALYSMTRTSDPVRLAGCWVPSASLTGKGIEERIQLLGALMGGRFKAKVPEDGFMHPEDWYTLSLSLQNRGQRALTDESTRFGYKYVEVVCGGTVQKIFSDPYVPKGTYFALPLGKYWWLASMEKLVHPLNADGLKMLRKGTTDDYEFRLKSYPALYTNAPLHNGRVALT